MNQIVKISVIREPVLVEKIDDNKQVNKYIEKIIPASDMKKTKQESIFRIEAGELGQRKCL